MTTLPKAWLTRSGRYGERDDWALANGVTPGGFDKVPNLSACASLNDVRELVTTAEPDVSVNAVGNFAAQLWALAGRMAVGDYVVLPRKETSQVAIGRITVEYEYRAEDPDPDKRHVRTVEWLRTDVPRSSIKQDFLYSLGAFSTYCQVSRNEAAARSPRSLRLGRTRAPRSPSNLRCSPSHTRSPLPRPMGTRRSRMQMRAGSTSRSTPRAGSRP